MRFVHIFVQVLCLLALAFLAWLTVGLLAVFCIQLTELAFTLGNVLYYNY